MKCPSYHREVGRKFEFELDKQRYVFIQQKHLEKIHYYFTVLDQSFVLPCLLEKIFNLGAIKLHFLRLSSGEVIKKYFVLFAE